MNRMIGLLMMVGLVVGFVGCGGDKATNPNGVPVANAGSDITGKPTGDSISLDGSESADPEGETLSYNWMSISDVENWEGGEVVRTTAQLSESTTATPHFVPTEAGVYLFSLTVNDGNQDGLADTVAVYVVASNQDLLVGTWLDEDGDPTTLRSDGTFVDYEGDEGTWSLVGDQLTIAYNDEDYGSATVTLNSVTDTELTFTNEDGERVVFTRKN